MVGAMTTPLPSAAAIDAVTTGAQLAALLEAVDVERLDSDARLAAAAGWQRLAAWVEAGLASAVVAVVGDAPTVDAIAADGRIIDVVDVACHELGAVLRETPGQVMRRVSEARSLVVQLPMVHVALAEGCITSRQARVLREAAQRLELGVAGAAEVSAYLRQVEQLCAVLLPVAALSDDRTLARRARRLVTRLDATGSERRVTAARRHCTDVWLRAGDDGLAIVTAVVPAEVGVAAMQRITTMSTDAQAMDGTAPIGMLRAAAFATLMLADGPVASGAAEAVTPRIAVDVVISLGALLGHEDGTAEVRGGGPVPASVVRQLIAGDAGAQMRRLITDPVRGTLLDVGRRRYRVDERMREFLGLRDQRCRFPGCTKTASACDVDHATNFDGGNSTLANLGVLCRTHHLAKTHAGWRITSSDAEGGCTWRSPHGRQFTHVPEPMGGDGQGAVDGARDGVRGAQKVLRNPGGTRHHSRIERHLEASADFPPY